MSRSLLDTSVLGRLADRTDPNHQTAADALFELHRRGYTLHLTPQVLIEYRGVATRPRGVNGFGFTPAVVAAQTATYLASFPLLPDTPDTFARWLPLVDALAVVGKQVHDARLAAVCLAHGVPALLTFNVQHFIRLAAHQPGFAVLDPKAL